MPGGMTLQIIQKPSHMQVYVDAPHLSSGELPADLPAALVNGRPTYEWWNAQRARSFLHRLTLHLECM